MTLTHEMLKKILVKDETKYNLKVTYDRVKASLCLERLPEVLQFLSSSSSSKNEDNTEPFLRYAIRHESERVVTFSTFRRQKGKEGWGRLTTDFGYSYVTVSRLLRHFLCWQIYSDHDVKACHHVLLRDIMRLYGPELSDSLTAMDRWLEDCKSIYETLQRTYKIDRDTAKKLGFKFLYDGSIDKFFREIGVENIKSQPEEIQKIYENAKRLKKCILVVRNAIKRDYPEVWDVLPYDPTKGKGRVDSGKFSSLLQHIERAVILVASKVFTENGYEIGDYQYDGLLLSKDGAPAPNDERLMRTYEKAESAIKERLGFNVKFEYKSMEPIGIFAELQDRYDQMSDESRDELVYQTRRRALDPKHRILRDQVIRDPTLTNAAKLCNAMLDDYRYIDGEWYKYVDGLWSTNQHGLLYDIHDLVRSDIKVSMEDWYKASVGELTDRYSDAPNGSDALASLDFKLGDLSVELASLRETRGVLKEEGAPKADIDRVSNDIRTNIALTGRLKSEKGYLEADMRRKSKVTEGALADGIKALNAHRAKICKVLDILGNDQRKVIAIMQDEGNGYGIRLDTKRTLFAFEDGYLYDLEKREYREIRRDDYLTVCCGCTMGEVLNAEDSDVAIVEEFFRQILTDEDALRFKLDTLAQCLDGNPKKYLICENGSGSNGKSSSGALTRIAFGSYCCTVALDALAGKGGPSPELMALRGKRLAFTPEPNDRFKLDGGTVNRLTGGDEVSVRLLHSNQIVSFVCSALILMQCNIIVPVSQQNGGTHRRFMDLNYACKFVDNPDPEDPLQKRKDTKFESPGWIDKYKGALLKLLIRRHGRLMRNGSVSVEPPKCITDRNNDNAIDRNPFLQFLEDGGMRLHLGVGEVSYEVRMFRTLFAAFKESRRNSPSQNSTWDAIEQLFPKACVRVNGVKHLKVTINTN